MSWWPVDSDDAREYAERDQTAHRPDCEGGWLPDHPDGRPRPCLECRPHLAVDDDGHVTHRATLTSRQREDQHQ